MTLGAMKDSVLTYLQYSDVSLQLDGPTVLRLLNEALQYVYQYVVANDPGFYIKGQAFVASASVTYAADHNRTLVVEIPAASASGAARIVSHKEDITVRNNTWLQPVSNYPIARINASALTIAPASTGTHWYIWQFEDTVDESLDVSQLDNQPTLALIPWVFEEIAVLYACYLAQARDAMTPGMPEAESTKRMNLALETSKKLEDLNTHVQIFKRDFQPLGPKPRNPQLATG